MTRRKIFHKRIATFFLVIFFPTLFPTQLFAYNNGPNAFDSGTFEPVDGTDMVNLATGDMSYVLPVINVPSPEGGYPLALSYHAGIAMDQEASWVGLGWSLNPGAINRNVNGYADDTGTAADDATFIYDAGGTYDYYSIGVGGNFNGMKAGVGAYWGSNKTFGGSVAFGVGPASVSVGAGTFGTTLSVGYSGTVDELSTNVTTGFSISTMKTQSGNGIGQSGTGISSSSYSLTQNDYNVEISSKNINIIGPGFNFFFGHTKIKYNLFKYDVKAYTGILYPNIMTTTGNLDTPDINRLIAYDDDTTPFENTNDLDKSYFNPSFILPNYDNYKVQAQGLSGTIAPTFLDEHELLHRQILTEDPNNTVTYHHNLGLIQGEPDIDYDHHLNTRLFFEFENTNASFLRVDRSNVERDLFYESEWYKAHPIANPSLDQQCLTASNKAKTRSSGIYNENFASDGTTPLKVNGRKRTGKFVEALTNNQIANRISSGLSFIEAKNIDRSAKQTPTSVENLYEGQSIGAYRITDVDGKVYHYSLPVLNYETWYKNFSNVANEDSKFIERKLDRPYATDWLLTAVTGPDYVDTNGNNMVDEADYGYWVEFDYGKWSDGYIWRGSSGTYDTVKGDTGEADRYEYYRGRKQIYYLDAVKTRTHTAYFVKKLRNDAQGENYVKYQTAVTGGVFNPSINAKKLLANNATYCVDPDCDANPRIKPSDYGVPDNYNNHPITILFGSKFKSTYADFPAHYALALDKIILVKNSNATLLKTAGTPLLTNKSASLFESLGFSVTKVWTETDNGTGYNGDWYKKETVRKQINIHQSENVIDINDIINTGIIANAEKVIELKYDPANSLMPGSNHSLNSNKGKLTLSRVRFLGKAGATVIPDYVFGYNSSSYSATNQDGWGYDKTNPMAASLNNILTPTGSRIIIQYQSDDYFAVAAKSSIAMPAGKGGGVRVRSILLTDDFSTNLNKKLTYFYNLSTYDKNPGDTNYKSSGVTSFVPTDLPVIIPYASELPAPVIMYKNVSVEESSGLTSEVISRTDYAFETLDPYLHNDNYYYNLGNYLTVKAVQDEVVLFGAGPTSLTFRKYELKNKLSNLGRLLSIKNYNSNNQLLSYSKNDYATAQDSQDDFGVKQESFFSRYRIAMGNGMGVPNGASSENVTAVTTISYPSKLLSTTTNAGGHTNKIYYDKYDLLTGDVLQSRTVNSDGKFLKATAVPAYLKYAGMGSKVDNPNNKNMLLQQAANYSYLLSSPFDTQGTITGVGLTTWRSDWAYKDIGGYDIAAPINVKEQIFRKSKSYIWNGSVDANGLFLNYNPANDDGFLWNSTTQPERWKQVSEVTLYDHFSNPLEVKDINGNYATSKMGDNDTKVMASGNAGYNEMFYAGMENITPISGISWLESGIMLDGATRSPYQSHTGTYSIIATNTSKFGVSMRANQHRSGRYKLSVWVHKDNAAKACVHEGAGSAGIPFNGESYTAGNWVLKTHYFSNIPNTSNFYAYVNSSDATSVYFDDFMLRPVASTMTGYVYDQYGEVVSIISNNGLATKFEYDAAGRLVKTYIEVVDDAANTIVGGFKLKTQNKYNVYQYPN